MAINFIKKEDLSHITRTTRQWETTIDRYEIIPKGVLCIELCNDKLTKIKIGNGHLIYEQLPYVSDVNLSDYYTKEETNNLIKDLKAIKIKGEASSLSDLPSRGNEEGDLWFVAKQDPDTHSRYDEYVWYNNKWESFGSSDIDLSEYAKKSYVDEHIQEVQNEITEIIESGYLHKHDNKNILDYTSAVYNVEKDNKLRDLHNYDDTELREKAHTHLNKNILDQTDAVYNRDKDDKLSSLHNYDDTDVKNRISTLEGVAHSHANQDILDRTTAAFTKEQALTLLDCKDFEGTDGTHPGVHGFVPAPTAADAGKVLGANGQWVEGGGTGGDVVTQGGGIEITTDSQTGVKTVSVNAGTGLDIDQQTGELYVTSTGGDTIAEGSGIDITTDSQTGVKTISVDIGNGLQFNQNSEIEVNTGDGLSVNQDNELEVSLGNGLQFDSNDEIEINTGDGLSINNDNELELDKATTTTIGGVIVGDNLSIDNTGTLSADEYTPGEGISIDSNKEVSVKYNSDGLSINASDELELDKATTTTIGGVIVGDNIDVNNGTISVPKAASNKLGVVKPTDGLSIDSNGVLTVDTGDGLSIDSTTKEVNVNVGRALTINQNNEIDVNIASRSAYGVVKVGEGVNVDSNGIISVEAAPPFRAGDGIILTDESERLPSGFTKIEYVESSSTNVAYTSINYYVNANSKFIGRMSKTELTTNGYGSSPGTVFGTIGATGNYSRYMFGFVNDSGSSSPLYCGIQCGNSTSPDPWYNNKSSLITSFTLNDIINFEASVAEGLKLNNELHQTYQVYGGTLPVGRKLGVMAADANGISSGSAFYGRLYFLKIYEGNVLKVSLVPCIQTSSSVPGLYDTVAGTFYASTSGNPFLYDPETIDVEVPDWVLKADIATSSKLGSVKVGSGLSATNDGELSVNTSDGLTINQDNEVEVAIGDGLQINQDGEVEVDPSIIPEVTEYRSGEAISIETVRGLQLTDYSNDDFVTSIASMNAGSIVKAADNSSFTLTASNNDCYTRGPSGEANGSYPYNVKASTKYRFAWDSANPTVHGKVYTYENAQYGDMMHEIDQYDSSYIEFTTSANTTFIQARFGVMYAGDSITYSNVRLYEVIEDEDAYDEISVKYGDGLTLNQNNELEVPVASSSTLGIVKIGHGVEIDPYGAIYVDAMVPFAAGVGLELIPGSSSEDALPEGYGKVDYIESNGNAYTIINYVPNRNSKVVGTALFRRDNWDPVVFGCRKGGGSGKQFVLWFDRYSSNQAKVGFVYGTNTWDTSTDANGGRLIPYMTGDQFSFLISVDDDCNINNTFVHNITDNGAPATDLNLGIFALAVTNSSIESDDTIFKGRIYDFKIYENDELVVNLVPAVRLLDEKVGFYDNINDAFYVSFSESNQFTTDMDSIVIDYQDTTLNTRLGTGLKLSPDNSIETNISSGQGIDISVDNQSANQHGLLVSTKLDRGLKFNLDDEIEVDIGNGLQFDANDKLTLDLQTSLINGNGISITPQTSILPAGYGQLSYIEGTGQQWTQLDYVPVHDSRVVVDCISYETTSTDRALFGCREGTGGRPQFVLWAGQKTTGYVTASFIYGSNVWSDDYNTGVELEERFTVDASYNGLYINGELFKSITDQGNMPAYKVALFTVANGDGTYITDKGMGKYRIYSFKIYEGNDLVVDLVPAISASTGVGLYDVVNDKFYTSLTATPFTYDPSSVVYPSSYQIATKIGSGLQYDSNGAIEAIPAGLTPATSSTLGGVIVGNGLTVTSDGTISTATGKAYIAGEGINMSASPYEFSAENEQYLFKSQVTCELHGDFNREFQKYTDDTALGMVWNVYDSGTLWSGPLFVGLSSDSVKYTTNSTTYSALGTFSYLGKTWYYSDTQMYVSNIDGTDYDGNMVVDTETYASPSEIVNCCKSLIDRARVILKVDEISLLPATEDTLGGIKIGEGLSIDEDNVVSSTVYEEGQGITFETSGSTDSFDVKNKQYYFEDEARCQITGNFGPRTYWRVYTDDPCLAVIFYRSDTTTAPLYIGLTANSVKMYQSWDGNVLGPSDTFDYKGYTWYFTYDYGLYYSSGVDQLNHLQTVSGTSSDNLVDVAKHVIDLAELINPGIKTYDVWNTGTGWLNGSYADGTSDTFYTNWYKEYHSDNTEYFELPKGATEVKLTGISTSDTAFGGNHIDLFNDAKHHIGTFTGESQWHELLTGTVYLQFGVKWNEQNTQDIAGSSVKSVTLEIKVPKNNAITAKLGDGLTFDENDAITLDESIKLIIHCVGTPLT